jgi:hypothetical protein
VVSPSREWTRRVKCSARGRIAKSTALCRSRARGGGQSINVDSDQGRNRPAAAAQTLGEQPFFTERNPIAHDVVAGARYLVRQRLHGQHRVALCGLLLIEALGRRQKQTQRQRSTSSIRRPSMPSPAASHQTFDTFAANLPVFLRFAQGPRVVGSAIENVRGTNSCVLSEYMLELLAARTVPGCRHKLLEW